MNKRKQLGIIKYGTKKYKRTEKMQGGGTLEAYAPVYNWREDPYEMMLMKQKMSAESAQRTARSRGGRKNKPTKSDYKPFVALKEGLTGSRTHYNNLYKQDQRAYMDRIQQNGEAWVNTYEAKTMHQNIINQGIAYEARLKEEKGIFKDSEKKMRDSNDQNAYAISNNGGMFVLDGKGEAQDKYKFIDQSEYLSNIDRYVPQTKDKLATYMTFNHIPGSDVYIKDFIGNGAMGQNSLDQEFLKLNRDRVKFKIIENKTTGKKMVGVGERAMDFNELKKGIESFVNGQGPINSGDQRNVANGADIEEIVSGIYKGVYAGSSDQDALSASLSSEVLKDLQNRAKLNAIKDPKKRAATFHRMKQVALVEKFFDASLRDPSKGNNGGGELTGGASKTMKFTPTLGRLSAMAYGKFENNSKYTIEGDGAVIIDSDGEITGDRKVDSLQLPMVDNIISPAGLQFGSGKDDASIKIATEFSRLNKNPVLNDIKEGDRVYLQDGTSLSKAYGNKRSATAFLTNGAAIDPQRGIDMVIMPIDKDGNPVPHVAKKLNDLKNVYKKNMRAAYNKSVSADLQIKTEAQLLLKGNKVSPTIQDDLKRYNEFIEMGAKHAYYAKEAKDNPSLQNKNNLAMATLSRDLSMGMQNDIEKNLSATGNLRLAPFASVTMIINEDYGDTEFSDIIKTTRGGASQIHDVEDYQAEFMDDIERDTTGLLGKDYSTTTFLMPIKSSMVQAAEKGEKVKDAFNLNDLEKGIMTLFEKEFVGTARDLNETIKFLKE